jgi:hypothetical protein
MSKTIEEQLKSQLRVTKGVYGAKGFNYKSINERYKKETDGVEHINISPTGKTELGRLLSLESEVKFVHPILGPFRSITNYWSYIKSKSRNSSLRFMNPSSCLAVIKNNNDVRESVENFKALIVRGCYYKAISSPRIKELLLESDLPFQMYYIKYEKEVTNGDEIRYEVKVPHKYSYWLIGGFNEIREAIKNGQDLNMANFLSNHKVPLYQDFADYAPEGQVVDPDAGSEAEVLAKPSSKD